MSKSLTERVMTVELKITYWKGFLAGVVATLAALTSLAGTVYAVVQTAKLLGE